jgi:hypothetical protein
MNSHLHLVPRFRMIGVILLLPLYAFILRTGGALSSPLKIKKQNRLENMTLVEGFQIKAELINRLYINNLCYVISHITGFGLFLYGVFQISFPIIFTLHHIC